MTKILISIYCTREEHFFIPWIGWMIIFGRWRRITRNVWPTHKMKCSHCNNEDYFYLKVVTTWFTLFFIPIFPYERYHFLYCPTCEYWLKLDSDQVNALKPLAKLNQRLMDWQITQAEYVQWLQDLSGSTASSNTPSVTHPKTKKSMVQWSYFESLHSKK